MTEKLSFLTNELQTEERLAEVSALLPAPRVAANNI